MRALRTRSRPHGSAGLTAALITLLMATAATAAPDIDRSVRPGDDFYGFANGPWLAANPPPASGAYGTGAALTALTRGRVLALVQDADARPAGSPYRQKVGDFYASLMDEAGIEAKGLAPLEADLAAIAAIHDKPGLSAYLGRSLRADVDGTTQRTEGLFGLWVQQGFDDGDHYYPHLLQGGLGLSDREDYLDPSPAAAEQRRRYQAHIAAVLTLAGTPDAAAKAAAILALETRIATAHASAADTADVPKTNNPWKRADFAARAPGIDWAAWFRAAGLDGQATFIVWQPHAVSGLSALVASQPLEVWKDYLRFRLLEHAADVLPKAFRAEHAAMFGGMPANGGASADRAQQALDVTSAALGEAVGRIYVERYFPPQAKAAAVAMMESLRTAWRARITNLDWMAPATREKALVKLAALKVELGYPDRWTDYSGLAIMRGEAYANARRVERFAYRQSLARLCQPVDPKLWAIAPHSVGAVILFTPNAMDFGAGILQPPYFDYAGDAASNYGSAGAGLAHEIGHSFDELGNQYDDKGRLVSWWTAADRERYQAATARIAAQASAYCPQPGLCVNGQQTAGENTADLAGLMVAHEAYIASLHGAPDVVKDGLTGEQRFFLAFAQRWRRSQNEAALRRQIATDIHAPGAYRSDTVRNLDAWYQAWGVAPGDRLYLSPEARARVW